MKRIANDVAVTTICYTMPGKQLIRVIDYPNDYDMMMDENGKTVFSGYSMDRHSAKFCKYFDSKVYKTEADGDYIVFRIISANERW